MNPTPSAFVPAPTRPRSTTTAGPVIAWMSPSSSTTDGPGSGAPGAGGAPRIVAIAVDAATGAAAITFDQPVRPATASIAPLYLVIYGSNAGCATPQGNGHGPVSGSGTRVLSLPATSLVEGVNYVTIAPGFATSSSGTPNDAVRCTAVTSASAPVSPTTTALPADAPVVVSAVMDAAGGTVTVTFDQPVTGAQPMDLVVYEGDATCSTPNGNAHAYRSGDGTATITADASSLVAGTTYITIASGWVTSANGAARPNRPLGCTAIHAG